MRSQRVIRPGWDICRPLGIPLSHRRCRAPAWANDLADHAGSTPPRHFLGQWNAGRKEFVGCLVFRPKMQRPRPCIDQYCPISQRTECGRQSSDRKLDMLCRTGASASGGGRNGSKPASWAKSGAPAKATPVARKLRRVCFVFGLYFMLVTCVTSTYRIARIIWPECRSRKSIGYDGPLDGKCQFAHRLSSG